MFRQLTPLPPRTADLVGRYLETLQTASGRPIPAEAVITALRLDVLDWRIEHGLIDQPVIGLDLNHFGLDQSPGGR